MRWSKHALGVVVRCASPSKQHLRPFNAKVPATKHDLNALIIEHVAPLADGEPATIVSIAPLEEEEGYGPMCSAWRVRGSAPLPKDYADSPDGTPLSATVAGIQTAWGDAVPSLTANRTLYNTL